MIRPPSSQLGPLDAAARAAILAASDLGAKYATPVDRRSAYEVLQERAEAAAGAAEAAERAAEEPTGEPAPGTASAAREFNAARRYSGSRVGRSTSRSMRAPDSFGDEMIRMVRKELTGTTGRRIVRGVLGGLFRGR